MNLLLVGTSLGALCIFETRGATLICLCSSLANGPITRISASSNRIIITTSSSNVNCWEIGQGSLEKLVEKLEENPEILSIDSMPIGLSTPDKLSNASEVYI
jgi:hypothetical protein